MEQDIEYLCARQFWVAPVQFVELQEVLFYIAGALWPALAFVVWAKRGLAISEFFEVGYVVILSVAGIVGPFVAICAWFAHLWNRHIVYHRGISMWPAHGMMGYALDKKVFLWNLPFAQLKLALKENGIAVGAIVSVVSPETCFVCNDRLPGIYSYVGHRIVRMRTDAVLKRVFVTCKGDHNKFEDPEVDVRYIRSVEKCDLIPGRICDLVFLLVLGPWYLAWQACSFVGRAFQRWHKGEKSDAHYVSLLHFLYDFSRCDSCSNKLKQ